MDRNPWSATRHLPKLISTCLTVGSLADRSKSFQTGPDDVVAVPSESMPVLLTQDEIELFVTA
ncbi:hypothetical protein RGR602_PC01872 (plasmid) [Rhizobium gallicum bv. gallicum R602sp]|uniref:Uncharacterized protein n=1 Tax=Rhizobium gallicum bv. gallicum R602sp TaxID=1041138 RepID=A0A0B4XFM1_9HYPH|nr:hypothetical protein RGR602_PC01872 [Rhizobium gallicum bv. gallicum R602sp]